MPIKIAQRLQPFCHLPGTICLIPFSQWKVQCYPTYLKFIHLKTLQEYSYGVPWKGPIQGFTIQLDLERGNLCIFGHSQQGFRRLWISMIAQGIEIFLEKENVKTILDAEKDPLPFPKEKLSLGESKKLDWELIKRRQDLKEILPLWFRLGQMISPQEAVGGVASLLCPCDKMDIEDHYKKIFLSGFEGLLSPRLLDTDHQGILTDSHFQGSPLAVLTKGASLIRSFFFQEDQDQWFILPNLAPQFHSGRLIGVQTSLGDEIDLEWSKKLLRRLTIRAKSSKKVILILQKSLSSFRICLSLKDRGSFHGAQSPLILTQGQTIFLDRFK